MAKQNIVTPIGKLKYCFIKGEGRNTAFGGSEINMCFTASLLVKEDSVEHKQILADLTKVWELYKEEEPTAKGLLKTSAIKQEMTNHPDGTIDPETDEVMKVPTGNMLISAYTKTTWADGKPKVVKKFAKTTTANAVTDITELYEEAPWTVGDGSEGIIHGVAMGNTGGGSAKLTLYLNALQITKLIKYIGDTVEVVDVGESIDMEVPIGEVNPDTPEI